MFVLDKSKFAVNSHIPVCSYAKKLMTGNDDFKDVIAV